MIYFTGISFQNHLISPKRLQYEKLDKLFYSSKKILFNELVITA